MTLPTYQISVYSATTGAVVAVLDSTSFDDLRYSRALNDIGALAMTLPYDPQWATVFALDNLIEVERTSPLTGTLQVEETYLTRLTHQFREGDDERFIVGGLSLNHLLSRRLIDPADDPAAAGGYSTKAGPADDVMIQYVREQCGDLCATAVRKFPNFTVQTTLSVGSSIGRRLRYDNLFETCQDIASRGGVDFIINRLITNQLRMVVAPIGSDKSRTRNYPGGQFVQLDPQRGNLSDPSLLFDRKKEQNYVYALGQGPGDTRIVSKLEGLGNFDSPYNRIEFTADVRTANRGDATTLATGARAALYDKQANKEFTFKPTGQEPGNLYRLDFDVGDILTCVYGDVSIDLRVRQVEISLTSDNEEISITVQPQ